MARTLTREARDALLPELESVPEARAAAAECRACYPWLRRGLEIIQPKFVLVLGSTAVTAVFGKASTIANLRGQAIPFESGAKAVATVHPSSLLRIPDKVGKGGRL